MLRYWKLLVFIAVLISGAGVLALAAWRGWPLWIWAKGIDWEPWTDLGRAGFVIILVMIAWMALRGWVSYRMAPDRGHPPSSREATLLVLARNAGQIVLIVIGGMTVLSTVGVNIAPLLASAGVMGLAIGFGSQKLVQDIITGLFIQFENAINVGDLISVGGITGSVEKLTVRSVSLRDLHGAFHIIPFSSVDMVTNFNRGFAYHVCDMGVAYREDIDEAKAAMHDAFEELRTDPDFKPVILGDLDWMGLNSFGDSAIVLRARIKTRPGKQWMTGRAYNLILKRVFDERRIEIPFPHQTIYFGEDREGKAPPLHVLTEARPAQEEKPKTRKKPPSDTFSEPEDEPSDQ